MKTLLPLIIMFTVLIVVGGKMLLAKQYCWLCINRGYNAVVSAPDYFTDSLVTVFPSLF